MEELVKKPKFLDWTEMWFAKITILWSALACFFLGQWRFCFLPFLNARTLTIG
jgi:hypothetical protein